MEDILRKNKETYDALVEEYEEKSSVRRDFNAGVIKRFVPFITTGKKILDVGCAVGVDLEIFKEKGFIPIGIEFSHEMVLRAKKRNPGINGLKSQTTEGAISVLELYG